MALKLFTAKRERGRVIQNLRVVVDYRVDVVGVHVSRSKRGNDEVFQWVDQGESEHLPFVDSEKLRDAFFEVDSPDALEAFLCASGLFRSDAIEVTWDEFQKWQAYFKLQRRLGAAGRGWGAPPGITKASSEVTDRIVRMPKFEPLISPDGAPILSARAFSTVECIAAVNYLERWSNTVVMSCRQCGDPFAPKTKASIFCKHGCAHSYWRANGRIGERKGVRHAKAAK